MPRLEQRVGPLAGGMTQQTTETMGPIIRGLSLTSGFVLWPSTDMPIGVWLGRSWVIIRRGARQRCLGYPRRDRPITDAAWPPSATHTRHQGRCDKRPHRGCQLGGDMMRFTRA